MPRPMRTVVSRPAASAVTRSRPETPRPSAIARAGGTTSGVTWHRLGRYTSQTVTAVTWYPFRRAAPRREKRPAPIAVASSPAPRADATASTWVVSSPCRPARALAIVSSRRWAVRSRTRGGIASAVNDAAQLARVALGWVGSKTIVDLDARSIYRSIVPLAGTVPPRATAP